MITLGYASIDSADIHTVVRFDIPAKIPLNGTASLAELSTATNLPKSELGRTIRYAITKGVFTESAPDIFAHTAASATLAKNKPLRDMTLFNAGQSTRIVVCVADALWARYGLKKSDFPEAGFNEGFPQYKHYFDYLEKNQDKSQEYGDYLAGRAALPRYIVEQISNSPIWKRVDSGTIIDVSIERYRNIVMNYVSVEHSGSGVLVQPKLSWYRLV